VIVLDTSILAYAVGGEHPLRHPCRRLMTGIKEGWMSATTTVEVIQEFVHVRSRRVNRRDAARVGRLYAVTLDPLLVTEAVDLEQGLRLFDEHPRLGCFDAMLAAVALRVGAEALVSADEDFRSVRGLKYVHPRAPEFERLLSG
jgi:hypothetical protein